MKKKVYIIVLLPAALMLWGILYFINIPKEDVYIPGNIKEQIVLTGVQKIELEPATFRKDMDFGKGKLGEFFITAPTSDSAQLKELSLHFEGLDEEEISQAWLRINGIRIYTTAKVSGNTAIFNQFPLILKPNTLPPYELGELSFITQDSGQETQYILTPSGALSQTIKAGEEVRIGLYGKWSDTIETHSQKNGIRICLDEIVVNLEKTGVARTQFATPMCWTEMGIEE